MSTQCSMRRTSTPVANSASLTSASSARCRAGVERACPGSWLHRMTPAELSVSRLCRVNSRESGLPIKEPAAVKSVSLFLPSLMSPLATDMFTQTNPVLVALFMASRKGKNMLFAGLKSLYPPNSACVAKCMHAYFPAPTTPAFSFFCRI